MAEIYIPGFKIAPAANRLAVLRNDHSLEPGLTLQARHDLRTKQAFCRALGKNMVVAPEEDSGESSSVALGWRRLSAETSGWVNAHILGCDLSEYARAKRMTTHEAIVHAQKVAREGVATAGAFLEVIPKVLMNKDLEKPNAELERYARQSKGLIVEWMGLDTLVDPHLAYAVAETKPQDIDTLFDDLTFSDRWFYEQGGRVKLDPTKIPNLRGYDGRRIANKGNSQQFLFGCPAQAVVPKIYDAMVNQAGSLGLFEQTYSEERAKYGYI